MMPAFGCQGDGPFDNFLKVVKRTVPLTTPAPLDNPVFLTILNIRLLFTAGFR